MRHENEGVSNTNVCAVAGDAGFRYHYYSNVFYIFICMSQSLCTLCTILYKIINGQ